MKLIGKKKEEIVSLMSNQHLDKWGDNYLVYSCSFFFMIKTKIYIEFNKNGIANMIIPYNFLSE